MIYSIGLILAILLIVCVLPLPYGYYMLVRFISMIYFIYAATIFINNKRIAFCIIAISIALLLQPFFRIVLSKPIWNFIDVIIAIILIYLWYKHNVNSNLI